MSALDPSRVCLDCGEWKAEGYEHRCLPGYREASVAGRLHLESWSDREESTSYCTGNYEYPSTQYPIAATCRACLAAAVLHGERLAMEAQARLAALVEFVGPEAP